MNRKTRKSSILGLVPEKALNTRKLLYVGGFSLAFMFMYLVNGCQSKPAIETDNLPESVLSDAQSCAVDTIGINPDDFPAARKYYVYKDSVLIVVNDKPSVGHFLDFVNINTGERISSLYKYGKGHGELMNATVDLNDGKLFVNDFMNSQFSFVDMDSVLMLREKYMPYPIKHNTTSSPTVVPYKDLFIVENPYCYSDEREGISQGVEQGVPRFILTDGKEKNLEGKGFKYNPRNVAVDGRIARKDDGSRYVYASFGQSIVEFYDENLKLIKMVKGPKDLPTKYKTFSYQKGGQQEITYKGRIPYAFLGYCCDKSYVYLMYIGDFYTSEEKTEKMNSYILQFDWDGNFIKCYNTGLYTSNITKGNQEGTFYATTLNDKGLPILIRLQAENE